MVVYFDKKFRIKRKHSEASDKSSFTEELKIVVITINLTSKVYINEKGVEKGVILKTPGDEIT